MKSIRCLSIALFCGLLTVPLAAQKRSDPRTMPQPETTRIPTLRSLDAALQGRTKGSMTSHGTIVGRATIEEMSAGTPIHLQGSPDGTFTLPSLGPLRIERAANGTSRWIEGKLGNMADYTSKGDRFKTSLANTASSRTFATALGMLDSYKLLLGLKDPGTELAPMKLEIDEIGDQHVRFQQVFHDIPVWGRDIYVHTDPKGNIYLVNGTYEPTPSDGSTTPALSAGGALDAVVSELKESKHWNPLPESAARKLGFDEPQTKLVLYPMPNHSMRLAYEVTVHPNLLEFYLYIVDAHDGSILNKIAQHCSLDPAHTRPLAPTISGFKETEPTQGTQGAGTFGDATATGLGGVSLSFRTYHHTDNSFYMLWDLPNFQTTGSTLPDDPNGGAVTINAKNHDLDNTTQLQHVTSGSNSWSDPSSVSAHVNMFKAYNYYRNTFSRKAIDDKDQSMISVIHVTEGGQGMDNAFWNGRFMVYGDGFQLFKPLAGGLDVAGHEMTHGVIASTANLIYQFQSGALNESFADVFGIMVDRSNFTVGEDVMLPGQGPALRDMENPDNPQLANGQPAHMNQFRTLTIDQDNGGVHINSGITNKAAVLIIKAIGREKTETMYYRALTTYLTRNSEFIDCRNAVEQAAKDLFGDGVEAAAVRTSFTAVGIGSGSGSNGDENNVDPLVGKQIVAFVTDAGKIGWWDFDNNKFFVFNDPAAVVRITNGDVAQLSAPRDGRHIWFINQQKQLSNIDVITGVVNVFPQYFINQAGDLWNAVIAPDESVAAIVSAYENDRKLYFANDTQIFTSIELLPESTQDGIKVETIKYPDVIAWSPNETIPRIAFDAFNEVPIATDVTNFWGIYEIDFTSKKIYDLLPAQPSDISVGNITYSKTDPNIVAFNVVAENVFDTYVANFQSGKMAGLNIPSFTINGVPITDGQRPTFSPTDDALAFTSPSMGSLLFFDAASLKLTFIPAGTPIFNPLWFTITVPTSVAANESGPGAARLLGSMPNPFSSETTIRFELSSTSDVRLDLIDALGRQVSTLLDERMEAGTHSAHFDAGGLPSGIYTIRLHTGRQVLSQQVTLVH